jgi:hypothetical protein
MKMIITNNNEITYSLIGFNTAPHISIHARQYSAHLYLRQQHKALVDAFQYSASLGVSLDAI